MQVARVFHSATSATGSATTTYALLKSVHDADTDVEATTITTPAQCEPGSKLGRVRLHGTIVNNEDGLGVVGALFHCMLVYNKDADFTADANTQFMNSDQTATAREIRHYTLWKRAIWVPTIASSGGNVREFTINRRFPKAGRFQPDDHLQLWIYHGNTDAATVSLWGSIYYQEH